MISKDIKKLLLAGTALVAVGGYAVSAQAADEFFVDGNDSGTFQTSPDESADTALDLGGNVDHDIQFRGNAATINVQNGEVIGLNPDTTIAGITASSLGNDANGDTLTITNDVNDATAAIVIEGGIDNGDVDGFNVNFTSFTENVSDADESLTVDVQGNIDLGTGTLSLVANDGRNDTQSNQVDVSVDGNITAGTIVLDANDATDGDVSDAQLILDGTSGQTIAAAINGQEANDGLITITNSSAAGVNFTGVIGGTAVGAITVNNDGNDQAVRFTDSVTTNTGITLGDNSGTDTVTATFGGSSATTITGAVAGGGAADTVALVFTGGDTVTLAGAATSNIDTVQVTGNSTLDSDAAITATTITVDSGSTLDQGAGLITGTVANAGTINLTGTGGITGNVTGAGSLSAQNDATVTGSIANSVTIADNVTLTVDGTTGDETLSGNVVINDSGVDDGLTINDQTNTITVSGDITTGTADQGLITISNSNAGTVAFTGNVGTAAAEVGQLDTGGGNAQTVTTTGNLYVADINIDDADVLQFLGTSAQVVSGTVDGVGGNDGVLTIGNGTTTSDVTFQGLIGAGSAVGTLNVSENAAVTFAANATFGTGGDIDNDGTITINSGVTVATGDGYNADADAGTFNLGVKRTGGTTSIGTFDATAGGAIDLSNDTVNFVVEAGSQPLVAGTVASVIGGNTGAGTTAGTITDTSFIYDITLTANGNDFDATVSVANDAASTAANSGQQNTYNQLLTTLAASTDTQINLVQGQLSAATTQQEAQIVLEAAASDVSGGSAIAGFNVAGQTAGANSARLAYLRGDAAETGMVAGNIAHGLKMWGQLLGSTADQDDREGVSGYDADTFGVAVGVDTETLAEDWVWGLAFAYGDTEVDSKSISNAQTEVDSYQLSLYGEYDFDERTYINGQIGYVWAENDTTRNPGGVSTLTASGDYDSDMFTANVEVGRDFMTARDTRVTPKFLVNYAHYSADGYTETGAGGANLTVDTDDMDLFEVGVGVDASWTHQNADGSYLQPVLRAGVRHDLIGDEFEGTNTFTGGGTAFQVQGFDPAQTTFNVGGDLVYYSTTNWELSASYDFELKSDYDSHTGRLKAAYKF